MAAAASSTLASSKTRSGALPPSSRWTRFSCSAAAVATSMPARMLPVTETIVGTGWDTRALPVSLSPQTTLSTPGGRNSAASSASRTDVTGVLSAGLSTTVFPAARAGPIFHTAIISG